MKLQAKNLNVVVCFLLFSQNAVQGRSVVVPKAELSVELGNLLCEFDVSIMDRLTALLDPQPVFVNQPSNMQSRMFRSCNPSLVVCCPLAKKLKSMCLTVLNLACDHIGQLRTKKKRKTRNNQTSNDSRSRRKLQSMCLQCGPAFSS